MPFLSLQQLGVCAPTPLFCHLNFCVGPRQRIGVVARNGGGKSTLLRCLAGLAEPTDGRVCLARGARCVYVEQDVPGAWMDVALRDVILAALPNPTEAWKAEYWLGACGVPMSCYDQKIGALSGGWQKMAMLIRAFATEADVMLLDEPTNHLDLEKIQALENWILTQGQDMPMVIVSHDRAFLDAVTTHTLFLRPGESKLYAHPYSAARSLLTQDDAADQAQHDRDLREMSRLRQSAQELKNIGINSRSDSAQKKAKHMAARAQAMATDLKKPHKEKADQIALSSQETHARLLLAMDDVVVRAPDGRALFKTGRFKLFRGDRLVLSGANGVGKTQWIQLLSRAIAGQVDVPGCYCAPQIIAGYADQQMSGWPHHQSPFDIVAERFDLGDQRVRTLLAGIGFPVDRQASPLAQFSPGQKVRLGLLVLRLTQPNLYLLDEPTNHVDIEGQEKLEAEILRQDASCILISHDRRFVQTIGTRFLRIEKGRLIEEA